MKPRPYQQEIIDTAKAKFKTQRNVLIQAPTGAGKTIIFSFLIRDFIRDYPGMRICVLVHREILVSQNAEKMAKVMPDCEIGIACASASKDINITAPVVFGSVQTMVPRMDSMPAFHLIIIDEAHRLPPRDEDSQYKAFLTRMEAYYPGFRLLGLTATPYRLGHGPIYGKKYKRKSDDEPQKNWFDKLDHSLGIKDLQDWEPDEESPDAPYLCQIEAYQDDTKIENDLRDVRKTGGDFNQGALSDLMSREVHISTAVDAYEEHCKARTRCVVFAVDIKHATLLVEAFHSRGIKADSIHSKQAKDHRRQVVVDFDEGRLPVIVNVGVLVEGWDCRAVDMMLMARPTLAPALYVQMVGRGLRTWPGKKNCLLLDLAGNIDRHGPPWEPNLVNYENPGPPPSEQVAVDPICPRCGCKNQKGQSVCQECGEILKVGKVLVPKKMVSLRKVDFQPTAAGPGEFLGKLTEVRLSAHTAAKTGAQMLRVIATVRVADKNLPMMISHFYTLEGFGRRYFERWWNNNISTERRAPQSIHEALDDYINVPGVTEAFCYPMDRQVTVAKENKYLKIKGW